MGSVGKADTLNTDFPQFQEHVRAIVDVNTEALEDQGRSSYFFLEIQGRLPGGGDT